MILYIRNIGCMICTTHIPSAIILMAQEYRGYIYSYPGNRTVIK